MNSQLQTDVLIVGAGPTGLMAACQLIRFGIDFIIIDKKKEPTKESRAILVTARSMEIYEQMGLSDEILTKGKLVKHFSIYTNGNQKVDLTIGEMGKGLTQFSHAVAFEQSKNESLMVKYLKAHGGQVLWEHECEQLIEEEDSVILTTLHQNQQQLIHAKYVIACDGASSTIRTQLEFSFRGGTYAHLFFVADTTIKWKQPYDKLILTPGATNFCAFFPLYGDENVRIIGTLPRNFRNKKEVTFDDLKTSINSTSNFNILFTRVNWFSIYKLHHRAVNQMRKNRIFLAGDSAHIHSPAGGQGMNTGLQDAYNLSWKLAMVLNKKAKFSLLDTYDEERLPFAKWLLQFTDRAFTLMTSTNWAIQILRRFIALPLAGMVLTFPRTKAFAFRRVSQIWYHYRFSSLSKSFTNQRLKFRCGDRLPYLEQDDIYAQLTNPSFHLIYISNSSMDEKEIKLLTSVLPFEITVIYNSINEGWKKLGVKMPLCVLVRPDNYIASIFDPAKYAEVKEYLKKYYQM